MTGISVVTTYATVIFQALFSEAKNHYYSAAYGANIMAGFKLFGAICPLLFINRLKRKTLLFSGFFLSILGNGMMAGSFLIKDSNVKTAFVIAATAVFVFGFEFGPGTV